MTTGERLVSISTLTTGTALDHLMNISTGTDTIIYGETFDKAMLEDKGIMVKEQPAMKVTLKEEVIDVRIVKTKTRAKI